jgi:2-polyprenyl-3-methyl-5-hydroxy-6-metoxy-1,4-benzoquinol methylase
VPGIIGPSLKRAFVWAASAGSRRHAWLLPRAAADDARLLDVRAPYRLETEQLGVEMLEPAAGSLEVTVLGYAGHFPTVVLGRLNGSYPGPCRFELDCRSGSCTLAGQELGRLERQPPTSRFCCRFVVHANGGIRERTTSHYVAGRYDGVDEAYFTGANYVDYEAESEAERADVLQLLDRWKGKGPLLEIGCATGSLLLEIERRMGITGFGLDISEWAISEAARRLGPDRVAVANIEADPIPEAMGDHGPFATIVLFSVLEHLANPPDVLARLSRVSAPGTLLLLQTTNADSLAHRIFGRDWEGYFDWTHKSVECISTKTVTSWLESLGWRVAECRTWMVWDRSAEPTHATLREWFDADARFRRLIVERDLGDLLWCIAIKQ